MKIKALKIEFESLREFVLRTKDQLKEAVESGKPRSLPRNVLRFASIAAYQQVMSDQKYTILAAIYRHKPKSIYQLAKVVGRSPQNVFRDCKVLEGHGFIYFEDTGESRKTKTPKLIFEYNAIVICMPHVSYKIDFDGAAA